MRIPIWKQAGLAVGSLALVAGRCNYERLSPPLPSLRVEPDVVCAGGEVCVIWEGPTTSTVSFTATPPEAVTPRFDPAARQSTPGRFCFAVINDLTLRVSHHAEGSDLPHNVDFPIQVVTAAGTSVRIAAAGECVSGRPSWPPVVMEAGAGVNTCQVVAERNQTQVSHGSATASIPPGSTTSAFAGTPLAGEWQLTPSIVPVPGSPAPCTPAGPGTVSPGGPPGAVAPPEALIQVLARCGGC